MKTVALNSAAGRWLLVSTILATAMAFIDATGLNVVLPSLQESLHANATNLFWVLNGYLLMVGSFILIGGALGDKLGRKKIFMTGIFIFIIGSACCGFAGTVIQLVCFRILQGIGGAMMIPGSLSMISSSIEPKQRGKAIGIWSAFTTVCTMGGPILGGALADAGLWRYFFFINIPLGIISLVMLFFKVSESREAGDEKLDLWGAGTLVLSLALLTFGFLRIPEKGLHNTGVYLALIIGLFFLFLYIVIERKGKHPMMPLNLFSSRVFSGANLLTFFLYAGLGASMLFLSLNFIQVQGYSQFEAGLTFLPFTILMVFISGFAGSLSDKYGARFFLIAGPVITGIGQLLLSGVHQTNGAHEYFSTFLPGVAVLGFGMSITVAPLTTTVMTAVSDHHAGVASGINNAMTRISGLFANAVFGALAILFFSNALQHQINNSTLDENKKAMVMAQASNLGNATTPPALAKEAAFIQESYHESFITAYANIMRICAGLSFFAAIMTVVFIKNNTVKKEKDQFVST
ncbi:MFS transporter [Niastella yeongjuensis]|uniref:MFS transporter n=1 Tax=Niastella yeongjuensis TaxID=354355 RepID=A0A1V9E3U4_9BACT|nr:MFS transporter [Niastella yeongjuensis]OQP40778.1 MFS transporter [Niastella yeongjuensis]SEP01986.1 drug resistance transporter, EmrB/QacA subfamily [Niastella yeongjuensis]